MSDRYRLAVAGFIEPIQVTHGNLVWTFNVADPRNRMRQRWLLGTSHRLGTRHPTLDTVGVAEDTEMASGYLAPTWYPPPNSGHSRFLRAPDIGAATSDTDRRAVNAILVNRFLQRIH